MSSVQGLSSACFHVGIIPCWDGNPEYLLMPLRFFLRSQIRAYRRLGCRPGRIGRKVDLATVPCAIGEYKCYIGTEFLRAVRQAMALNQITCPRWSY